MDQRLNTAKFRDPAVTARGEARASVALGRLETLWFNTGTLCNIECGHCYIESGPKNDRLAYLSAAEVTGFLDEIAAGGWPVREIGFTGGEPFMNPEILAMLEAALGRGFAVLVLTNAMKPLRRFEAGLAALAARYGERLTLRVSLDHYSEAVHDAERGGGSFEKTVDGIGWLAAHGLRLALAARHFTDESEAELRAGFAALIAAQGWAIDAADPAQLVIFPEMDATADVPEITTACWGILGKSPEDVMCSSSRMVVKRQGAAKPVVLACTLIAYDEQFELGATLAEADRPVPLNHPHCAKFCVLGGASCSAR
ncbi:MAG: radical SAM protein [Alphaproteobacteria bacterium]|nr:radical SAM protein [Alphaproteobacteria bacterium]MDE2011560.1 radical SAM protein [Alphaproteobacteria bacterium]